MRALLMGMLIAASLSPAFAQLDGMQELSQFVQKFNEKSRAAVEEYHRTGDHARYKRTIEPLLDELQQKIVPLKNGTLQY